MFNPHTILTGNFLCTRFAAEVVRIAEEDLGRSEQKTVPGSPWADLAFGRV